MTLPTSQRLCLRVGKSQLRVCYHEATTAKLQQKRKKQSDSRKGAKHAKAGNGIRMDCLGNIVPSVFSCSKRFLAFFASWR